MQLLLLRGETILKPHKFACGCQECRNKMKFDQLRLAKYRLNAFRGLASEAYISLSSKDPVLTAFELGAELKRLSREEKHFKVSCVLRSYCCSVLMSSVNSRSRWPSLGSIRYNTVIQYNNSLLIIKKEIQLTAFDK